MIGNIYSQNILLVMVLEIYAFQQWFLGTANLFALAKLKLIRIWSIFYNYTISRIAYFKSVLYTSISFPVGLGNTTWGNTLEKLCKSAQETIEADWNPKLRIQYATDLRNILDQVGDIANAQQKDFDPGPYFK